MKTKENSGSVSAKSPLSDMMKCLPSGADIIAAGGSRTPEYTTIDVVYSYKGETNHVSFKKEGVLL